MADKRRFDRMIQDGSSSIATPQWHRARQFVDGQTQVAIFFAPHHGRAFQAGLLDPNHRLEHFILANKLVDQ
jgi:hypothetical protein